MSDLTQHQRDILVAMLQGKRIECNANTLNGQWMWANNEGIWDWITTPEDSVYLRIAPNQDEAVRLYGHELCEDDEPLQSTIWSFNEERYCGGDTHYIDISPNGFIVGGKIEESK